MTFKTKLLMPPGALRKLEEIITNHDRWEARTMADLRVAGFRFRNVDDARWNARQIRELAALTGDPAAYSAKAYQIITDVLGRVE